MARWLLWTLILGLVSAGCLGDEASLGDETMDATSAFAEGLPGGITRTEAGGLLVPWEITNCRHAVVFIPVDGQALRPHTPDGFELLAPAEAGLPPDPRGDAVLGVETFACESVLGIDENATSYGSYFWFVDPPDEIEQDVDAHFIKIDVLIPDQTRRELLQDFGVPARDGSVSYAQWVQPAPLEQSVLQSRLSFENGEGFTVTGAGLVPEETLRTLSFEEFTPTENGLVVWTTTFQASTTPMVGPVDVQLTSDSFAAEIVGNDRALGYVVAGWGSFEDGTIRLPPKSANATLVASYP